MQKSRSSTDFDTSSATCESQNDFVRYSYRDIKVFDKESVVMKRILLLFLTGFALLTGCTAANEEAGIPDPGTEKASESQAVETGKANRILPKGDILSMTKNIAGESITFPEDESTAITALVEKIESADVIEEADARNPDSHLLGFDFLIMLKDADGNAISVCLAPFDDGRVSITIEEKDNDQTIWVKSSSLVASGV